MKGPTSDETFLGDSGTDKTFIQTSCCALEVIPSVGSRKSSRRVSYHEPKADHTKNESPVESFTRSICQSNFPHSWPYRIAHLEFTQKPLLSTQDCVLGARCKANLEGRGGEQEV